MRQYETTVHSKEYIPMLDFETEEEIRWQGLKGTNASIIN